MFEEKTLYKTFGIIAGVIVLGCFAFMVFGKPATSIDQLQADTDRNLGNIKAESAIIGVEIERSKTASDNVKETIGRINAEVSSGREVAGEIAAGIDNLERIIGECQRLAGENATIIDNIDRAN